MSDPAGSVQGRPPRQDSSSEEREDGEGDPAGEATREDFPVEEGRAVVEVQAETGNHE